MVNKPRAFAVLIPGRKGCLRHGAYGPRLLQLILPEILNSGFASPGGSKHSNRYPYRWYQTPGHCAQDRS